MTSHAPELFIDPQDERATPCACCGNVTRVVWGAVDTAERRVATYFVAWTAGSPQHDPSIDLIVGAWGEGAKPEDRVLVSLLCRLDRGGGVMVVDGAGRPSDKRALCGRALARDEVIGTPLAATVFAMFDAIWLQDARIAELRDGSAGSPQAS